MKTVYTACPVFTLTHKQEALLRWGRIARMNGGDRYIYRIANASTDIDWDRLPHSIDVIACAGYCLDNVAEVA